jgi:hypothetical protein
VLFRKLNSREANSMSTILAISDLLLDSLDVLAASGP